MEKVPRKNAKRVHLTAMQGRCKECSGNSDPTVRTIVIVLCFKLEKSPFSDHQRMQHLLSLILLSGAVMLGSWHGTGVFSLDDNSQYPDKPWQTCWGSRLRMILVMWQQVQKWIEWGGQGKLEEGDAPTPALPGTWIRLCISWNLCFDRFLLVYLSAINDVKIVQYYRRETGKFCRRTC